MAPDEPGIPPDRPCHSAGPALPFRRTGLGIPAGSMGSCRDGQPTEGARTVASNLTRNEAGDRARLIKVESYRIDLDLTGGETTFRSRTTIAFHAASPGASSFVDLTAPDIREITLNGRQVGHENFTGHRIYACFDQPDLKARFEFTVTVPDTWLVVSNMAPDVTAAPAGPGTRRWHFPATPPMSTYITAIAAGPYHVVQADHDGIPLGIYCRESLASYLDPDEIFEVTRQV